MNPKQEPEWDCSGKLHYPFYLSKKLPKLTRLTTFDWIDAHADAPDSHKYFNFLVAGASLDFISGKIYRYEVEVSPKEDKQKQLQFKEVEEFKLSYHVINCRTSRSLMAARTAEPVVHLYRLNKPGSPPNKLSSSETLQNTNSTLAWRGDSEKLGAATNSRRICIWDITSQKATEVVQYHKKDITDLIWLNNKCLASSSNNGEICIWSTQQPKPICCFRNKFGSVKSLAVLKEGNTFHDSTLLSGGSDKTVTLWDLSRRKTYQYREHNSPIVKILSSGVINKERSFAALDETGRIVLYNTSKESIYSDKTLGVSDFHVKNGYFGVVGQHKNVCVIWCPLSQSSFTKSN